MQILILIFLTALHLAPLLFFKTNMWIAQGIFSGIMIGVMFGTFFLQKPLRGIPRNLPLALLFFWVAAQVAFLCYGAQVNNKIDFQHFFPFFNFLCIIIFYICVVCFLNQKWVYLILKFIRYAVIGELLLCVLQYFGLAQFFALYQPGAYQNYSIVVGLLGNGTHLSGFLAMCSVLFLDNKRESYLALILMVLVLFFCSTTVGTPAISGFVVLITSIVVFLYNRDKRILCLVVFFGAIFTYILFNIASQKNISEILSFNGRLSIWEYYLGLFKSQGFAMTGYGLGTIGGIFQKTPFPTAMHLHNEYLHYMFELGIVGITLIIYLIVDFLKKEINCTEALQCKIIFIGFLVSSLFNYPSHLWMVSIYSVFAYGAVIALERGQYSNSNS